MEGIKIFERQEFGQVRVVDVDGEPWFVARDVAQALGYVDTTQAIRMHCEKSKDFRGVEMTATATPMKIIPEEDVYALIFGSHLESAKKFRRWLCDEVLPSIRKTGTYSVPSAPAKPELSVQSEVECALLILKAAGITGKQLAIAADNYYRKRTGLSVIEASGVELVAPQQVQLLTPTQLGKELGLSGRKVNLMLAGLGLQRRIGDVWEPTEDGKARGAVLMDTGKRHGDGAPVRQLKWPSDVVNALR